MTDRIRSKGLGVALALGMLMLVSGMGEAQDGSVSALAAREAEQRQHQVKAAQTLFSAGAAVMADGSYAEAMDNFKAAFETIPNVPAVADQRRIFFQRYQTASYSYTQQLIEEARWPDAEATLATVLQTARDHDMPVAMVDPRIRQTLGDLRSRDDRFNMATSPRHLRDVELVESKLIIARGYLELGDYDRADRTFNEVLNIDPYNTAARRGMEKVERHRMNYYDAAYNHTRSRALSEVAASWETPVVNAISPGTGIEVEADTEVAFGGSAAIERKLNSIMIPRIEFGDARLIDVVEYLAEKSQELDTLEPDPARRGVNIVVDSAGALGGEDLSQRQLSVKLSNIPLADALKYVTGLVGMKYRVDRFAVFVVPSTVEFDAGFITRKYTVPPGFVSAGNQGAGAADAFNDPFSEPVEESAIRVSRITAKEFLENSGVVFPEGTSANYSPATSTLVVTNTVEQLSTVEYLIETARASGEKMVKVGVRMVSISEEQLNVLGLDWLLGAANFGSTPRTFFGGGTNGNSAFPALPQDYAFVNPATNVPVGMNPITSGLRLGDVSTNQSFEDILSRNDPGATNNTAPGIFSVAGAFTDPQFQAVLRALSQKKATDFLCNSHVLVKPGQIASLEQAREFIYPTEYDPPEIPNSVGGNNQFIGFIGGPFVPFGDLSAPVTPANPTAFETRRLGKVIEVEPNVSSDNLTINLNVTTDFSDFVGFINYGTPIRELSRRNLTTGEPGLLTPNEILMPVFDSVKETTNVTVWDGQTIAIGGFHGENLTDAQDKVPIIGDLPAIGSAFRSTSTNSNKRALIIFVSVLLVDPGGNPINAKEDPEMVTQNEPRRSIARPPVGTLPAAVYPTK
ncbi:MAG: Amuc_1098 family type IV pilus outer membrane protein [Verrucomicrobiota bacterium]